MANCVSLDTPLDCTPQDLFGKHFGDKGYLSQALVERLFERGLELITTLKKNMTAQLMLLADRLLLRKRFILETIHSRISRTSSVPVTARLRTSP